MPGRIAAIALVTATLATGCRSESARVVDEAGIFSADEARRLTLFHDLLMTDHGIDYRVLSVRSVEDLNVFAAQRFAELEVGALSPSRHGLLLVIDPGGKRIRMEVGYGLEGFFPDAFVAYVEHRQMVPFFAAGRAADGVLATTELIVDRAQRYRLGELAFDASELDGSGGAGATARTDASSPMPAQVAPVAAPPGASPEDTLARYFEAMARRDGRPDLPIYSMATRAMLDGRVMTPAQMDHLVATYRACTAQPARMGPGGSLAVIRYGIAQRRCAPWFLVREDGGWQLDLTMMSRAIRFGRDNSWHFAAGVDHPYGFAFDDWRFDSSGFPAGPSRQD